MTKCKDTFDIRVSMKCKYLRSNQGPFLNIKTSKTIMDRTRLRNRFLRTRSNREKVYKEVCNKQWNYCVSLVRKTKQDYYNNLEVADNKSFWKYIKPLF